MSTSAAALRRPLFCRDGVRAPQPHGATEPPAPKSLPRRFRSLRPRPPRRERGLRRPLAALSRSAPRQRILAQLVTTPGIHLRALGRCLDLELSTLENHLRVLQRQGHASSRSFGYYKAYYPSRGVDRRDWVILFYLLQEQPGRILRVMANEPSADHARLTAALAVTPSTCSFHLKKLQQAGLVDRDRYGRRVTWALHEPARVAAMIERYPAPGPSAWTVKPLGGAIEAAAQAEEARHLA